MAAPRKIKTYQIDITTDGTGAAAVQTAEDIVGFVDTIRYVKGNFSDGVDFTVINKTTGETIWAQNDVNASTTVHPRKQVHTIAGVAAEWATGIPALEPISIGGSKIEVQVGSGGAAKVGTVYIRCVLAATQFDPEGNPL